MTGISRRAFGRLAAGAGMLGSVGVADGCAKPAGDHGKSSGPPPPGNGVGFVLSHEQFRTDNRVRCRGWCGTAFEVHVRVCVRECVEYLEIV